MSSSFGRYLTTFFKTGGISVRMRLINDHNGPLVITGSATISGKSIGTITVTAGSDLRVNGEVSGDILVEPGGALALFGRVKGAVINHSGAVDIFGFVGRVADVGKTETYVCRGAIVGGKRAPKPGKLSSIFQQA